MSRAMGAASATLGGLDSAQLKQHTRTFGGRFMTPGLAMTRHGMEATRGMLHRARTSGDLASMSGSLGNRDFGGVSPGMADSLRQILNSRLSPQDMMTSIMRTLKEQGAGRPSGSSRPHHHQGGVSPWSGNMAAAFADRQATQILGQLRPAVMPPKSSPSTRPANSAELAAWLQ